MGVVPTGTLEDSHAQALENWEAGNLDLESFVAGEGFNRPDSLALWAYLEEEHTEAFRDFRDEIDGGLSTEAEAFADILSSPLSHEESYEQWLMVHQEPLAVVYTGWLHLDQLHIAADVSGTDTLVFAPLKEAPASFSMRVLPQESFFSAGPMTSFDDWDHWSVVIAEPSGAVYALLYGDTGGAWQTLASIEASAELQISYAVTDQATELQLNGEQQLFSHEQTGSAGLGVYNSSVIFELDW
jgi:hypothetical protein